MDAQKGQPAMKLSKEDIIESLETCCLCGSKLRFSHQMDYLNLQVHEEAKCSECGIKSQSAQFILQ
jgi:hypothetical protein